MLKKLFVYGTLMNDSGLAATIEGDMFDLGPYPGVIPGDGTVVGELHDYASMSDAEWEAQLVNFDRYEGVGSGLYRREKVFATLGDGTEVETWVYFYGDADELRQTTPVPDGAWRERF